MKRNVDRAKQYKSNMVLLVCVLLFAVLLFVDLITKAAAHAANVNQSSDKAILGLAYLKYESNPGMMLSMFADNGSAMVVVTILTVFMILGIAAIFCTVFRNNTPARVALAVIEAGAIGNLADRLNFGYVRDFLHINRILFFPEYTCNVADIYILFGAIALVFIILFIGKHAAFPITKKWREEAKAEDEIKKKKKATKK